MASCPRPAVEEIIRMENGDPGKPPGLPEAPRAISPAVPWMRILAAATPGLGLALAACVTGLRFPSYHDEGHYLPLARLFSQGVSLDLVRTYAGYPSALGPAF